MSRSPSVERRPKKVDTSYLYESIKNGKGKSASGVYEKRVEWRLKKRLGKN